MSISPPSDIILDVARAADPARSAAAAARLSAVAADPAAFGATLDAFAEADGPASVGTGGSLAALAASTGEADPADGGGVELAAGLPFDSAGALTRLRSDGPGGAETGGTYRRFEAMVLASFVESMLPTDSTLFGSGTAGSVWRAMLAEQIAGEMANGGGIGIAAQLASSAADSSGAAA